MKTKAALFCTASVIILVVAIVFSSSFQKNNAEPVNAKPATQAAPSTSLRESMIGNSPEIKADTQADKEFSPEPTDEQSPNESILQSIHQASIQYEPGQIANIAPYLIHPEPEVRQAAVDGLIVLGERSAATHLRESAKQMNDPREAVMFLDAADFLELPSFKFDRNLKE